MSENQKLRDALSELIEAYNRAGPELSRAERAVDRMRLIAAHEALALPTADHIPDAGEMVVDHLPDAGKMIETAAPVGEREDFEEWAKDNAIRTDLGAWDAWQARAALSAGVAVDAQRYRWLRDEAWAGYNKGKGFPHVFTIDGAGNRRTMLAEDALDASIDAAMRKGQL